MEFIPTVMKTDIVNFLNTYCFTQTDKDGSLISTVFRGRKRDNKLISKYRIFIIISFVFFFVLRLVS